MLSLPTAGIRTIPGLTGRSASVLIRTVSRKPSTTPERRRPEDALIDHTPGDPGFRLNEAVFGKTEDKFCMNPSHAGFGRSRDLCSDVECVATLVHGS